VVTEACTPAALLLIAFITSSSVLLVASMVICVPLMVKVPLVGVVLKPALFSVVGAPLRPPPIGVVVHVPLLRVELVTLEVVARRVTFSAYVPLTASELPVAVATVVVLLATALALTLLGMSRLFSAVWNVWTWVSMA